LIEEIKDLERSHNNDQQTVVKKYIKIIQRLAGKKDTPKEQLECISNAIEKSRVYQINQHEKSVRLKSAAMNRDQRERIMIKKVMSSEGFIK
jgi:hypothetical protein